MQHSDLNEKNDYIFGIHKDVTLFHFFHFFTHVELCGLLVVSHTICQTVKKSTVWNSYEKTKKMIPERNGVKRVLENIAKIERSSKSKAMIEKLKFGVLMKNITCKNINRLLCIDWKDEGNNGYYETYCPLLIIFAKDNDIEMIKYLLLESGFSLSINKGMLLANRGNQYFTVLSALKQLKCDKNTIDLITQCFETKKIELKEGYYQNQHIFYTEMEDGPSEKFVKFQGVFKNEQTFKNLWKS